MVIAQMKQRMIKMTILRENVLPKNDFIEFP